MKCPRGKTILCRIQYEGVPICTCPDCEGEFVDLCRACKGLWLDDQELALRPGEVEIIDREVHGAGWDA